MTNKSPQKRSPSSETPTPASQWKKASQSGAPLRVPSGNTALVRSVGMQFFLAKGIIPNSLMPMVMDALNKGKPPQLKSDVLNDQEKLKDILKMVDEICIYCVIEPALTPSWDSDGTEISPADRDADVLYVDEVDLDDKMFIFQYVVGGTKDIETFRKQLESGVESLQPREDVGSTT